MVGASGLDRASAPARCRNYVMAAWHSRGRVCRQILASVFCGHLVGVITTPPLHRPMRSALRSASHDPDRNASSTQSSCSSMFDPGPTSDRQATCGATRIPSIRVVDTRATPERVREPLPRPRSGLLGELVVAGDYPQPSRTERRALLRMDVGTRPTSARLKPALRAESPACWSAHILEQTFVGSAMWGSVWTT